MTDVECTLQQTVYTSHLATYRNPINFKHPDSFIPERWLSEYTEFASEKKHAFQPFSVGARACLGRNMAYHEIRIIFTKVLWNFDLHLCAESTDWSDQKIYILWNKRPLWVKAVPVRQ